MSKRLTKELQKLMKNPSDGVEISLPEEDNIHRWDVQLSGPQDSPYSKGKFDLSFEFPATYPFKPPIIRFTTKIYHPNINKEGEICAAVLYEEWGPTLNVEHCISVLLNMMKEPNPDSPLDEEIAKLLREKPKEFDKNAKQWTKQYAMK
eukprot:166778_1